MDNWNWSNGVEAAWRGRYLILGITLLAAILTTVVVLLMPRSYEAVLTLRVGRVMERPLDDPGRVAGAFNGASWSTQLAADVLRGRSPYEVASTVSVSGSAATGPFVTIVARDHDPSSAARLATAVADVIIKDHEARYTRLVARHTQYRDDLKRQVDLMSDAIAAGVEVTRKSGSKFEPTALLARMQLDEKESARLKYQMELRDAETGLLGGTERTHMVGTPAVGGARPPRTRTALAGTLAGALLAVFWVVASDGMRRTAAAVPR